MSWQATLSGHIGSMEKERELLFTLKEVLNKLNSEVSVVSSATVVTAHHGRVDLMATNAEALGVVVVQPEDEPVEDESTDKVNTDFETSEEELRNKEAAEKSAAEKSEIDKSDKSVKSLDDLTGSKSKRTGTK